jgi:hypothetical protein
LLSLSGPRYKPDTHRNALPDILPSAPRSGNSPYFGHTGFAGKTGWRNEILQAGVHHNVKALILDEKRPNGQPDAVAVLFLIGHDPLVNTADANGSGSVYVE